jgi:DNA-binding transcriptional LysR family regulator
MDIESLEALLLVMEEGSLAAAAVRSGGSRSTLRRRIERLESQIGFELFVRDAKGSEPTPAARVLATRARPLLDQVQALLGEVRAQATASVGAIHLMIPPGVPPEVVALGFFQARQLYPGMSFEVSVGVLEGGELPAGVDLAFHFGPAPPRGAFRTRVIARLEERLLASEAYLATHGTPSTLEELASHTLLVWRPPDGDGRTLPLRSGGRLDVAPALISTDIHMLRACAQAGQGIAYVPDGELTPGLGVEGVRPLMEELVGQQDTVRMVVPEVLALMPRTRSAIELIESLLSTVRG